MVNTVASMHYALEQGADGLEFDVRITSDGIPVVIHDSTLYATHKIRRSIHTMTLDELTKLTTRDPVPTLRQVLDVFWGTTYLNIELKSSGSGAAVLELLTTSYVQKESDWKHCFVSSFKVKELRAARNLAPHAPLALLHNRNPFAFLAYHYSIKFAAIGFHRLYVSEIAVFIARRLGLFTYAYTVNRPHGARLLRHKKLDAVVTDFPRRIIDGLRE